MKKKYFLPILVLVLAIFLSGCSGGGGVIPITDEAKIKSVIHEWSLALNDLNWSKAKSYCVNGSDVYYTVEQMKDLVNSIHAYCNIVTVNVIINISDVSINGSYAEASGYGIYLVTYCGYAENDEGDVTFTLQKIGNNWKLY